MIGLTVKWSLSSWKPEQNILFDIIIHSIVELVYLKGVKFISKEVLYVAPSFFIILC